MTRFISALMRRITLLVRFPMELPARLRALEANTAALQREQAQSVQLQRQLALEQSQHAQAQSQLEHDQSHLTHLLTQLRRDHDASVN